MDTDRSDQVLASRKASTPCRCFSLSRNPITQKRMYRKLVLQSVVCLACCAFGCGVAARGNSPASWQLALRLYHGERITERMSENDKTDWKLPERRLERFRKAGVIINEEEHITSLIAANVVSVVDGIALLRGTSSVTSFDVPRNHTQTSQQPFTSAVAPNNMPIALAHIPLEDAAMAQLPGTPLRLGEHWQTRLAVITNLGSGHAVFDHEVITLDNGLLEIAVHGVGAITGTEYHLPKLLPGTIDLAGSAWYDPAAGLIVRESYLVRNRIIKPMAGEDSGFDERLTVDITTRKV